MNMRSLEEMFLIYKRILSSRDGLSHSSGLFT
jgi:hypothetical protein